MAAQITAAERLRADGYSIGLLFVSGPIVFVSLGAACLIGWKMTAQRHAAVRAELDLRDASIAATIPLGDA